VPFSGATDNRLIYKVVRFCVELSDPKEWLWTSYYLSSPEALRKFELKPTTFEIRSSHHRSQRGDVFCEKAPLRISDEFAQPSQMSPALEAESKLAFSFTPSFSLGIGTRVDIRANRFNGFQSPQDAAIRLQSRNRSNGWVVRSRRIPKRLGRMRRWVLIASLP